MAALAPLRIEREARAGEIGAQLAYLARHRVPSPLFVTRILACGQAYVLTAIDGSI
jgi:hypothetical protein